jgi:hypothetical protein
MSRSPELSKEKITYCKTELFSRGWTQKLINELLPEPIRKNNPHYRSAPPMLLWDIAVVEKAEKTERFIVRNTTSNEKKAISLSDRLKTLENKVDKVTEQPGAISMLDKLDLTCRNYLRTIYKYLKLCKNDDEKRSEYFEYKKKAVTLLKEIRSKYSEQIYLLYGCSIDISKAPVKVNISAGELAFTEAVNTSIPDRPKDEYAITRLTKRHFIIHSGVTNTGKTYHAIQSLKVKESGVYLAPLRLLALQVYQQLNDEGCSCSLLTGEEEIVVSDSKYVASTIEKLNIDSVYDIAIIDEAQMIADDQRGSAWTKAVLGVIAGEIHICCSENAVNLIIQLIDECGDTYEHIQHVRDTPLIIDSRPFSSLSDVEKGDALIAFSKRTVLSIASALADKNISASVIYGNLPPETRKRQIDLYLSGTTDVVVATDAIGMGLNLPVKRIVFMEEDKFDGLAKRSLNATEIKQIAGRAGRKNIFDCGLVNAYTGKQRISGKLNSKLENISSAYYLPLDKYILSLPVGTLRERLTAAVIRGAKTEPFKSANISQPLALLRYISEERALSLDEQMRLIFVPFDIHEEELVILWKSYTTAYIKKSDISLPPAPDNSHIEILETYYKKLDLYYSFCKSMKIQFDADEVALLKQKTAERINALLITQLKNMGKKCRICNNPLDWHSSYGLCGKCHELGYTKRYNRWR